MGYNRLLISLYSNHRLVYNLYRIRVFGMPYNVIAYMVDETGLGIAAYILMSFTGGLFWRGVSAMLSFWVFNISQCLQPCIVVQLYCYYLPMISLLRHFANRKHHHCFEEILRKGLPWLNSVRSSSIFYKPLMHGFNMHIYLMGCSSL